MAVLGEVDRAVDVHGDRGVERGHGAGVEDLGGDAEFVRAGGGGGFLVEGVVRFAEHGEALLDETELVAFGGEGFVAGAAGEVEIAEERGAAGDVLFVSGLPEAEAPCDEVP